LSAQKVEITISCKDHSSGKTISNFEVDVFQNGINIFQKGTENRILHLNLEKGVEFELLFKSSGFENLREFVFFKKDTAFVFSLSSSKIQNVGQVEVVAPGKPYVVFQSKQLSVSDFEFLENGDLLLLLYPKTLKKGSELAIFKHNEIEKTFKLKENPIELISDFRGNPQVVCEKGVYGIFNSKTELGISNLDKKYFMKYIFPIVDTSYSKFYFSNFNKNYPAFDYKIYDQLDSTYSIIAEVQDDLMMELYRSEYKWVDIRTKLWAKNLELQTGIDKEIWVGANYFTNSIYYKELYAPLFKVDEKILLFDYYKDSLFTFNLEGQKIYGSSIGHHKNPKESGWRQKLMQDKTTKEIYALFEKDGNSILKQIDINTGEIKNQLEISHKYPENVAVQNGIVYYTYRPFESMQKKFLYKQLITD
jgi:hypothetical protein